MTGTAMRVLRTVTLAISLVMPFSAGAVWNGVVNPPLGQPDGTTQTFIDLPDQPTQQAVDSDACNDVGQATNDPCPPGFDWYVQSDYKWKADLGIKLEYRNSNDVVVGEGRAQTGLDGNVTQWTGYTIQTEFGTIRVGDQYAGREGTTSPPSDSNSDLVNKGADRTQWSDGWGHGDRINVTPDTVNKVFQDLFPLSLKPRLSISGYIDSGHTFESDGHGLQRTTDLPANYWSGLDWSTSQNWDTGFEVGPKTDVGPIGTLDSFIENKWGVDYKINADGWLGQRLGLDYSYTDRVTIAPVMSRPQFEIGFKPTFDRLDLLQAAYIGATGLTAIPDEAGGGFVGSFTPSQPDGDDFRLGWGGFRISSDLMDPYPSPSTSTVQGATGGQGIDPAVAMGSAFDTATLGGPLVRDKLWFFVNAPCEKVLKPGAKDRPPVMHMRIQPPTAADFVANPDEPRTRWHKDYDGALPIVVKADAGKAAIGAAIGKLVNAPYAWFVPNEVALQYGADSTAGPGDDDPPAAGGGPEVVVADDDCDQSTTVIVPGGNGVTTTDGGDSGLSTQTRDPNEPCDCAKEEANVAEGQAWVDQVRQAYEQARTAHQALLAEWAQIRVEHNRRVDAMVQAAQNANGVDTPELAAARDNYYDYLATRNAMRDRVAESAEELAYQEELLRESEEALRQAEEALAACQQRCGLPSAAGGTNTPSGLHPGGTAIAPRDNEESGCNCTLEEQRLRAAQQDVENSQARLDALISQIEDIEAQRERLASQRGRQLGEKARLEHEIERLRIRVAGGEQDIQGALTGAETRMSLLQEAMQTTLDEKSALTNDMAEASRRLTEEVARMARYRASVDRKQRLLEACRQRCGHSGSSHPSAAGGSGTGTGPETGPPSGTSTTAPDDDAQQPCDCSELEQALQAARRYLEEAEQELARQQAIHDELQSTLDERRSFRRGQLERFSAMASRLTEIEAAMADGRTDLDQLRDGLVARGELMGEAIEATNAEIVRLEQEFLQILSSLEVQGMLTADAQHRVMDAEAALSDCQSRCPPGGGR